MYASMESMSKLVIVESPTKAKTLSKILGNEYTIEASMGHIRDLPKKGLGVDVEHNFKPEYEIPQKSKKVATALKKAAKTSKGVILATDPDREGEAIAWHLKYIISNAKGSKTNFERVVFHELTKDAVLDAFSHPSKLNENLVDSQQARRVLDRLVGYKLSPLLWKKVRYGLSAGRVQSVAVRLIVEKERERQAFETTEYWSVDVNFETLKKELLTTGLEKKDGKKLEIGSEKEAQNIEADLKDDKFKVASVTKSEKKKNPYAPLKTSTLQQNMANTVGMSANKTMRAAQKLFEQGLITYHRTDSITLAPQFVESVRAFAKSEFGAGHIPDRPVYYKTKSKNAQEAHEAIRPTNIKVSPSDKSITKLGTDAKRVYTMIWRRSLESQMKSAVYDQTTILVDSEKGYQLKATGSVVKFDGWLAVAKKLNLDVNGDIETLPEVKENEDLKLKNIESKQHFTQPPARYSDASLIKKLEELGIGRPSTYAPTITTITSRGYVQKEGRYFIPKDVAFVVTDLLVEHFPNVVGYDFTAEMEEEFDQIALGEREWVPVIKEFYEPFEKILEKKDKELNKRDVTTLEELDEKCPECGSKLNMKLGKYGKFISCSNYPECEFAKPVVQSLVDGEDIDIDSEDFGECTECEDGKFVLKQGRFGKFLACSNYPKCKTTKPYLEKIGMKCPKCRDGEVIIKKGKGRTFYGCSNYPDCDYASWKNPMQGKDKDTDSDNDES
jgi:DNA topoisomerase I